MVQAVINIEERANRVLNIVKAKFGLRDKSEAINLVVAEYEQNFLEPELRPEYIKKARKIMKSKKIHVGNIGNFRKRYGIK
ncbi:antitoxin [Candidatus Woesearchaeota archaeon]|nr:MAG: antitoxin [Candidatus Woesearchaeota archaeon]